MVGSKRRGEPTIDKNTEVIRGTLAVHECDACASLEQAQLRQQAKTEQQQSKRYVALLFSAPFV